MLEPGLLATPDPSKGPAPKTFPVFPRIGGPGGTAMANGLALDLPRSLG